MDPSDDGLPIRSLSRLLDLCAKPQAQSSQSLRFLGDISLLPARPAQFLTLLLARPIIFGVDPSLRGNGQAVEVASPPVPGMLSILLNKPEVGWHCRSRYVTGTGVGYEVLNCIFLDILMANLPDVAHPTHLLKDCGLLDVAGIACGRLACVAAYNEFFFLL